MSRIKLSCIKEFWGVSELFFCYGGKYMYQAEELRELSEKPRINDISLDILRQYYSQYLMPFIYSYKSIDGINETEFKLIFDDIRFCHLLGVESIAKGHVSFKDLCQYRGKNGWKNIESKKLISNILNN